MNSAFAFFAFVLVVLFLIAVHTAIWAVLIGLIVWAFALPVTWFQIGVVALIVAFFTCGR